MPFFDCDILPFLRALPLAVYFSVPHTRPYSNRKVQKGVRKKISPPIGRSIDPPFCIECPLITTFHPMTPFFCFFDQNFLAKSSNFEKIVNRSENLKKKKVKIAWSFCAISHPTTFLDLSPNDPIFARKLSLIALWFDVSAGALRHFYTWVPPGAGHLR